LWTLHSQLDTAAALAGRRGPGDAARARSLAEAAADDAARTGMARVRRRAASLLHDLR
jgi:hypothetical protein